MERIGSNELIYSFRKGKPKSKKSPSFSIKGNCLRWSDNPHDYLLFLTPPTIQQVNGSRYLGYFENAITNLGKFRLPERLNFEFPLIMIQGYVSYEGKLECILTDHMGARFFVTDKNSLLLAIATIEKATENRNVELTDRELRSLSIRVIDNHIYRKESPLMRGAEKLSRMILSKVSKPLYERKVSEEKLFFPDLCVDYTELKQERLKLDSIRKAKENRLKRELIEFS